MKKSIFLLYFFILAIVIPFHYNISRGENISNDIKENLVPTSILEVQGKFLNPSENQQLKIVWYGEEYSIKTVNIFYNNKIIASLEGVRIDYEGLCFDQKSKLHSLIFSTSMGSAVIPGDLIFIHYEKSSKSFEEKIFWICNHRVADLTNQIKDQRICLWREINDKKSKAYTIYDQISPSDKKKNFIFSDMIEEIHSYKEYPSTTKTFIYKIIDSLKHYASYLTEMLKINHSNKEFSLTTKTFSDKIIDSLKQYASIDTSTIFENNKWIVKEITYSDVCYMDSWGVLIAKQKGNDFWTSFYSFPLCLQGGLYYTKPIKNNKRKEILNNLIKKRPSLKAENIFSFMIGCITCEESDIFNIDLSTWNVFYLNQQNREN